MMPRRLLKVKTLKMLTEHNDHDLRPAHYSWKSLAKGFIVSMSRPRWPLSILQYGSRDNNVAAGQFTEYEGIMVWNHGVGLSVLWAHRAVYIVKRGPCTARVSLESFPASKSMSISAFSLALNEASGDAITKLRLEFAP